MTADGPEPVGAWEAAIFDVLEASIPERVLERGEETVADVLAATVAGSAAEPYARVWVDGATRAGRMPGSAAATKSVYKPSNEILDDGFDGLFAHGLPDGDAESITDAVLALRNHDVREVGATLRADGDAVQADD